MATTWSFKQQKMGELKLRHPRFKVCLIILFRLRNFNAWWVLDTKTRFLAKSQHRRGKQMSLLPPILEERISNFHQIWEGFLVVRSTSRNPSPNIPSITSGEEFLMLENPKISFPPWAGVWVWFSITCLSGRVGMIFKQEFRLKQKVLVILTNLKPNYFKKQIWFFIIIFTYLK